MQQVRKTLTDLMGLHPESKFMNEFINSLSNKEPRIYTPEERLPVLKNNRDWDREARALADLYWEG